MCSRIRDHTVALLSGSVESLHYIYALGKGSRKSHFLELFSASHNQKSIGWRVYSDTQHARDDLGAGIRVTSGGNFSRILPRVKAPTLILKRKEKKRKTVHLNVLSPLEQEARQNRKKRGSSRAELLKSSDPEIRSWPNFRSKEIDRIFI